MNKQNKSLKKLSWANRRLKIVFMPLSVFLEYKKGSKQYASIRIGERRIKLRYSSKWNNSLKFYWIYNQHKKQAAKQSIIERADISLVWDSDRLVSAEIAAINEAHRAMEEEENLIKKSNKEILSKLPYSEKEIWDDIDSMLEGCSISGMIVEFESPYGERQHEDYDIFKDIHVDQLCGFCEDDYYGYIYARVGSVWYRIPYTA